MHQSGRILRFGSVIACEKPLAVLQPVGELQLHKIVRLLTILNGFQEASTSGTAPAISAVLDALCPLIKVRSMFVYLCADDGTCNLTYRSSVTEAEKIDNFPAILPANLIEMWLNVASEPVQIDAAGANFVKASNSQDDADLHPDRVIVLPMLRGEQLFGAICYAGLPKDRLGNENLLQMLRDLTNILQGSLVHGVGARDAVAVERHSSGFAKPQHKLDALQRLGAGVAAVAKVQSQEGAMPMLASTAESALTLLTNAIQALPNGVVIFDAEDRVVVANAAYLQTFPNLAQHVVAGVKLEDLLRIGVEKGVLLGNSTEAEREAWLQARLLQYHLPHWDDEVQLPDGRWMHRVNTRTSDGGIIAMGFDITAKRAQIAALDAANKNLKQVLADRDRTEQRLSGIIDGASVGTWEMDVVSGEIQIGGRWAEILGLETENLTALTLPEFVEMLHPDDKSKILLVRDFTLQPETQIISSEFRMRHVDGHFVWILSRCRVSERAPDGTPLRLSGVHLDISEQKQLERDVFASRAFLLDVMDASSSAIVVLDESHRVSYVNQEAQRILGLIRDFEPGQNFDVSDLKLERIDGTPLAEDESPFKLALRTSQPVRNIQCAVLRPDGTRGSLSFNAALLEMGDQRFGVVSFSDVTENLAATQRLQEALIRAEEMSQAKSTFLANMSHEIRTPLNGVLGMAEVLADTVTEPLQRQMIDTIRKSGETLLTVLNGILDMSKIEAGKMVVELVPFVPLDLIRQAESIYTVAAEEKGVAFEVLATAGCDKPRLGDAHRLMQILNNLLNNAFKFTERGQVTLKVSCRTGKPVQIEVSDTGIGMDAAQVSRVFESFEQADGSMTRRFGGTGLGLSIVRQLVNLMGGTITAESCPGRGSKFVIVLPLPDAENLPATQKKSKEGSLREDGLVGVRLLCADDNQTNRLVLSEMLARTGAIVKQVENGREAVEAWVAALDRNEPFALLLLDITMPVLDGMSALAEIRAIESLRGLPPVSAVAVTAHAMPTQIADYLIGGFDSHLAKPFRRLDLLHALHSLLHL